MADDADDNGAGRWINFNNVVSFGNLLIVMSMLASAGGALIFVGREVRGLEDQVLQGHADLVHETEMRVAEERAESDARLQGERGLVDQIGAMANQESRDVKSINDTLQDMRQDYRELLRVSGPTQGRR